MGRHCGRWQEVVFPLLVAGGSSSGGQEAPVPAFRRVGVGAHIAPPSAAQSSSGRVAAAALEALAGRGGQRRRQLRLGCALRRGAGVRERNFVSSRMLEENQTLMTSTAYHHATVTHTSTTTTTTHDDRSTTTTINNPWATHLQLFKRPRGDPRVPT